MEYVDNVDWKQLLPTLSELDIKYYTFQLLKVGTITALQQALYLMDMVIGIGLCTLPRNHPQRRETWKRHDRPCTAQGPSRISI